MVNANATIAIIPSSQFKWTFQIQYKESLPSRDEAIRYASRYGCNLIVEYSKRSGPLFDVLQDPEMVCTSEANPEFLEEVDVEIEPESAGWTRLMFRNLFRLVKRTGTAANNSSRQNAMHSAHSHALAAK